MLTYRLIQEAEAAWCWLIESQEALPCPYAALSALALASLEKKAPEVWFLSPRGLAVSFGATSKSLETLMDSLDLRWVQQACFKALSVGEFDFTVPKLKGSRKTAWLSLSPSPGQPGQLERFFLSVLNGEMFVPTRTRAKVEAASKTTTPDPKTSAPLLEGYPAASAPQVLAKAPSKPKKKRPRRKKVKTPQEPLVLPRRFLALDVETTGTSKQDRVWEIAIACFEDGALKWERVKRFNPERELHWMAQQVCGVKLADLKGESSFSEVAQRLHDLLAGEVVVAHNLPFDKRMIGYEFARVGLDWPQTKAELCTLKLARPAMKAAGKKTKLNICCDHFGIELKNHHAAAADTRACGELLVNLLEKTPAFEVVL